MKQRVEAREHPEQWEELRKGGSLELVNESKRLVQKREQSAAVNERRSGGKGSGRKRDDTLRDEVEADEVWGSIATR